MLEKESLHILSAALDKLDAGFSGLPPMNDRLEGPAAI